MMRARARRLYDDYEVDSIELWKAIEDLRERLAKLEAKR